MKGLFRQSQHYMDLFCANMMDLNQRAEAAGYAYPIRDIFMENSGCSSPGTAQQGVPDNGLMHAE